MVFSLPSTTPSSHRVMIPHSIHPMQKMVHQDIKAPVPQPWHGQILLFASSLLKVHEGKRFQNHPALPYPINPTPLGYAYFSVRLLLPAPILHFEEQIT